MMIGRPFPDQEPQTQFSQGFYQSNELYMVGAPVARALKRKIQASAERASMLKNGFSYPQFQTGAPMEYTQIGFILPNDEFPQNRPQTSHFNPYGYEPQQPIYWPSRSEMVKIELRNSVQARQALNQPRGKSVNGAQFGHQMMYESSNKSPISKRHPPNEKGDTSNGSSPHISPTSSNASSPSNHSLFDDVFDDIPIGREDRENSETPEQLQCSYDWNLGAGAFEFDCTNRETQLFVNNLLSIS